MLSLEPKYIRGYRLSLAQAKDIALYQKCSTQFVHLPNIRHLSQFVLQTQSIPTSSSHAISPPWQQVQIYQLHCKNQNFVLNANDAPNLIYVSIPWVFT